MRECLGHLPVPPAAARLREGRASRAVIERAKGVLVRGQGLSDAESFAPLTDLSQRTHRTVRDVAADVLDGAPGLPPAVRRPAPGRDRRGGRGAGPGHRGGRCDPGHQTLNRLRRWR